MNIPLYILSGGQSKRFGADKARALAGSTTLLEAVAAALAPVTKGVTVIADQPDKYADLGFRTLVDERFGLGPLAGIERALKDAGEAWILVATCDVLGLKAEWVELLMDHRRAGAGAVAFHGERWEPLFALYHTSMLPVVTVALDAGELAVWRVLEEGPRVAVGVPEGWGEVGIINTPEALREYLLNS